MNAFDYGNSSILVGEFYSLISESLLENEYPFPKESDYWKRQNKILTKKECAKIVHTILVDCLNELDEPAWTSALRLKDIYDCHTCVIHIAQCYAKGIIEVSSNNPCIFGNDKTVSKKEAEIIVQKIFDKTVRIPVIEKENTEIKRVTFADLEQLDSPRLVDVREDTTISLNPNLTFEKIPLKEITLNPVLFGNDLYQNIVLCCNRGYQSRLAAEVLKKTGYKNLFVLSGINPC